MQILGDFVLRGEQIAKGRTKLGWCAIIDGKYVKESSRWKYSSRRRALCLKDGQDFIVETLEAETFPRFSYVLEDLNVDAAIYLVGGDSYAYGRDRDGDKIASGIFDPDVIMDNTSYILWKY